MSQNTERKGVEHWSGVNVPELADDVLEERLGELSGEVLRIVDEGLSCGVGAPVPGHMCVEAAVCYAMGLPHGDNPRCVSRDLRNFKISVNDSDWPDRKTRAQGMRRIAIAQLGTRKRLDDRLFCLEMVKRSAIPNIGKIMSIIAESEKNDLTKEERSAALELVQKFLNADLKDKKKIYDEFESKFFKISDFDLWVKEDVRDLLIEIESRSKTNLVMKSHYSVSAASYLAILLRKLGMEYSKEKSMSILLPEVCEVAIQILREQGMPAIKYMDELAPLPTK